MSKRIYVFGIGGTGSRVIRSLTMLLASGVKLEDTEKIVPIIIDLDIRNEDTNRTIKALDKYKQIRDGAYGNNAVVKEGFFSPDLSKLSSLRSENTDGAVQESFQFDFGGIDDEFGEYMKVNQMDILNKEFMKLLYDDSPASSPTTELRLQLTKGFKGNPNIGSIIFNKLKDAPEYKFFESSFREGDRIFIISSIFGGTGSSGFPQLLKILRRSNNNYISQAKIGAVTVMPYFAVAQDPASAIDSSRFISKTKAALSYYEREMEKLSSLYYVYDKPGGNPYDNKEGGEEQKNDAHVVEFLSATAIINFINCRDDNFGATTDYYEFGIRRNDDQLDFRHFFPQTQKTIAIPLTQLTYFAKFFNEIIPQHIGDAFAKRLNLDSQFNSDAFYVTVRKFINEDYLTWVKELSKNRRGFVPFNLTAQKFKDILSGHNVKLGMFTSDTITITEVTKEENRIEKEIPDTKKRFMVSLYQSVKTSVGEYVKDLPVLN